MHRFKFAKSYNEKTFTDVNEALLEASKLNVNPIPVTVGDISVTQDGLIKIGEEEKLITILGLKSYCKVLGIPIDFAETIPEDLLLTNIKRLTQDQLGLEVELLEREDGTLASIVKHPYKEIPYSDILGRFAEKDPINIKLSEELMKISFRFDELKVPGFNDSENTFYISEYLISSLVKKISFQAVSGLYRTQCENSFIMPLLGKLKANYLKTAEKRLETFAQAFEYYDSEVVASIFRNFSSSVSRKITLPQFKYIWDNFSNIASKSEADLLFQIDEDSRKILLTNATQYLYEVKKAKNLGQVLPEPTDTPYNCYDTSNSITTIAHERLNGIESLKAEILGGTILQWMVFLN
jgi:hypothetical protein